MDDKQYQEIKEEQARLQIAVENVVGYFDSFDKTLNNHMTDYQQEQMAIKLEIKSLRRLFGWAFWVMFGLVTLMLAGILALTGILLAGYVGVM